MIHTIVPRMGLTLAFALATYSAVAQGAPAVSARVVPPPPKPFVLPAYSRVVLPNGITVLLLEKHELPVISLTGAFRSGATSDPSGKEGLATLTASLLRKGTRAQDAQAISEQIDFLGMGFNTGVTFDTTTVSADFLKKDQDTALALYAELLLQPSFPAAEVDKLTAQSADEVRSAKDNPQGVINTYYTNFLYGDTPYGRPAGGDERSLKAIRRDDVVSFYRTNYTPANFILAVAGDFDTKAMEAKLTKVFASWQGKAPAAVAVPTLKPVTGRRMLLVDKPDATQTYFIMGNLGIDARNPDRGEIEVVNTLYGGRFTSLFNTELRIKSGYSYGAVSSFAELQAPGPFTMSTFTRNATTEPAMDKTIEVINTAQKVGFTAEQLTSSKAYIAGSLPPRLQTPQQLTTTMAHNERYGITREQFNGNLASMQATGLADEKRVLSSYFPTADNLVIVVIGKASEIEKVMPKYTANITRRKISDPGF